MLLWPVTAAIVLSSAPASANLVATVLRSPWKVRLEPIFGVLANFTQIWWNIPESLAS